MNRFLSSAVLAILVAAGLTWPLRADEQEARAILEKGIKALGGEEKLGKIEAVRWKGKSKITINNRENEFTGQATFLGPEYYRGESEGVLNGKPAKRVMVISGTNGWVKSNEAKTRELAAEEFAEHKRNAYLQLVPMTLVPLKGKGFKIDSAGEEKVADKAAVGIRAIGPDGKDFKLYFDKESGLPVKLVARVIGFDREEFVMETFYSDYKEFDGIKKYTKFESKREGKTFDKKEITEFKVLDKVELPAHTFAEPK